MEFYGIDRGSSHWIGMHNMECILNKAEMDLKSCSCYCFVSLPHSAVGWSAV